MDKKTKLLLIVSVVVISTAILLLVFGVSSNTAQHTSTSSPNTKQITITTFPVQYKSSTESIGTHQYNDNAPQPDSGLQKYLDTLQPINSAGDKLITKNENFQIIYNVTYEQIVITITSPDVETVKTQAENDILDILHISKDKLCQLGVVIKVDPSVNPNYSYADQTLAPSYCIPKT